MIIKSRKTPIRKGYVTLYAAQSALAMARTMARIKKLQRYMTIVRRRKLILLAEIYAHFYTVFARCSSIFSAIGINQFCYFKKIRWPCLKGLKK